MKSILVELLIGRKIEDESEILLQDQRCTLRLRGRAS
jgi:hypothetical protein